MVGRHADRIRYFRMRLDLTRLLAVFLLTLFAGSVQAAPKAKPWGRWAAHDPASTAVIDHAPWNRFLATYVIAGEDGVNRVAYRDVSPPDRDALAGYVVGLTATPIGTHNRDQQLAYWINLYNALTVRVVLEHYPVKSIRDIDISPGLFSSGPWGRKLVTVEGEAMSLDDIEHRVLRPIWRDPRIHYALNCAAIGCPNLANEAFTAGNANRLMDRAARAFVNHPRGVAVARDGIHLSSIYKWYRGDFGGGEAGVIAHLSRYAEPALARTLRRSPAIAGYAYDWALNETAPSS